LGGAVAYPLLATQVVKRAKGNAHSPPDSGGRQHSDSCACGCHGREREGRGEVRNGASVSWRPGVRLTACPSVPRRLSISWYRTRCSLQCM